MKTCSPSFQEATYSRAAAALALAIAAALLLQVGDKEEESPRFAPGVPPFAGVIPFEGVVASVVTFSKGIAPFVGDAEAGTPRPPPCAASVCRLSGVQEVYPYAPAPSAGGAGTATMPRRLGMPPWLTLRSTTSVSGLRTWNAWHVTTYSAPRYSSIAWPGGAGRTVPTGDTSVSVRASTAPQASPNRRSRPPFSSAYSELPSERRCSTHPRGAVGSASTRSTWHRSYESSAMCNLSATHSRPSGSSMAALGSLTSGAATTAALGTSKGSCSRCCTHAARQARHTAAAALSRGARHSKTPPR